MKDTEGGDRKRLHNFALNPPEKKNGILILPRTQVSETGSTPSKKNANA